jgi:hypothetical protein
VARGRRRFALSERNQSRLTVSGTRGKSGWVHPTFFARNKGTGEWLAASLGRSDSWTIEVTWVQKPDSA